MMGKTRAKDLLMITLDRAVELYLSTMQTENKRPRYIAWLDTRLRFFKAYMRETYRGYLPLTDLTVDYGWEYIPSLMERSELYADHPMKKAKTGKLKMQYIHGCGRMVSSFSTWAYVCALICRAPSGKETRFSAAWLTREELMGEWFQFQQIPFQFALPFTSNEWRALLYEQLPAMG